MAQNTLNFTKAALESLPPADPGKRVDYHDSRISGLILQVTGNGNKTFYFYRRINKKPKRYHLGKFPDLTLAEARRQAETLKGRIASGDNVMRERTDIEASAVTLAQAYAQFGAARKSLKPKTRYLYDRFMAVAFLDWQKLPIAELTKNMVSQRHTDLTANHGPASADGAMRFLRSLYNFASAVYEDEKGNSLLPVNPVQRLSQARAWHKPKRRTTWISPDQMPAWFEAVATLRSEPTGSTASEVGDYLLVVLLTGLRKSEAANLDWSNINLADRTLTVPDTKNGRDHTLPLSDYLYDLLAQRKRMLLHTRYVFPNRGRNGPLVEPRNPMRRVTEQSGVEFTLHDLRRTFTTIAERLDIPHYALKRLINHAQVDDVTAGYVMGDIERLRKPMQQITDFMLSAGAVRAKAEIIHLTKTEQG
ncbi:MAG: integrase [Haliea sp.]|uniref:tyrosine-type recombinase/integrase n=1 Tax=Haliea sp. TaxID=1932666 RepID=UPI000C3EC8BB|nr:site-specific integrase [Haliea sp.]MBM70849.1 integrase [Haliea sp.]|tara:strand:+ start:2874 stop:4133 length:1260 start_codon:yes stop_codon:yes gene_type:complete